MDTMNHPRTDAPSAAPSPPSVPQNNVPPAGAMPPQAPRSAYPPPAGNYPPVLNWSTNQPPVGNSPPPPNWGTVPPPAGNYPPPPNRGAVPPPASSYAPPSNQGAVPPPAGSYTPPPAQGAAPPPAGLNPYPPQPMTPPLLPVAPPPAPPKTSRLSQFIAGTKERVFAVFALIICLLVCNFTFFGDFNLGFGIAVSGYIICSTAYLLSRGHRLTVYSALLLLLSLGICAGFARSDDGEMKFLMVMLLFVSVNLGLCITAGQNIFNTGNVRSIGDVIRALFIIGYGQVGPAIGGLFYRPGGKSKNGKKIAAVLLGLLVTVPLLGILLSLLMSDAAFEAMMDILPDIDLTEALITILFGGGVAIFMYSRSVGLSRRSKSEPAAEFNITGINKWSVNTVLIGVCLVYMLYLLSQLTYFVGGFTGTVPDGYTSAQYARNGFYELIVLCVINLVIIILTSLFARKSAGRTPLSCRLLCLFIGAVTVFMGFVASSKMLTYIGSYGLTRMRVIGLLIIAFMGITDVCVCLNLLTKKKWYMQVLMITALLMGGGIFWADLDTVVATYNVDAYLSGDLEEVDVEYLGDLSSGAIPQIARLVDDENPKVAYQASKVMKRYHSKIDDFRDWNWTEAQAIDARGDYKVPGQTDEEYWEDYLRDEYDYDYDDYKYDYDYYSY